MEGSKFEYGGLGVVFLKHARFMVNGVSVEAKVEKWL